MATFPIVMTTTGYVPQSPASLNAQLIAGVSATSPGYTASLPATLIEDISSTDTFALTQCDSAIAELLNSLTPYGANEFLLSELSIVYGVQYQDETNTSVYVQFTGPPGWVISEGFTISDGTYQYVIPDGGVIGASGSSPLLYAVATITGSWSISIGTVNQFVTSVPSSVTPTPTVTNPSLGTPAVAAPTADVVRAQVMQAGLAASQGMGRYLKTYLQNVPGVQARLVSVKQMSSGGLWEVICGGGDQYQIAYAILYSLFDINALTGSIMAVEGVTNANPGVVTTVLNHGFSNAVENLILSQSWASTSGGQVTFNMAASINLGVGVTFVVAGSSPSGYNGTFVTISGTSGTVIKAALVSNPGASTAVGYVAGQVAQITGLVGPTALNGVNFLVTVITENTFSVGINTSSYGAYVSGGVVTPNFRNITSSLLDYPDTYVVTFVNPPLQTVSLTVTWNTISTNYVNPNVISQLGNPALLDYINTIPVGQPINLFELQAVFQAAVATMLPPQLLTRMVFAVNINGVGVSPTSGTGIIAGDPESYFYTTTSQIVINQG